LAARAGTRTGFRNGEISTQKREIKVRIERRTEVMQLASSHGELLSGLNDRDMPGLGEGLIGESSLTTSEDSFHEPKATHTRLPLWLIIVEAIVAR